MRTLERPLRCDGASAPVDEHLHDMGIIRVPGDQDIQIIRHNDQAAVLNSTRGAGRTPDYC